MDLKPYREVFECYPIGAVLLAEAYTPPEGQEWVPLDGRKLRASEYQELAARFPVKDGRVRLKVQLGYIIRVR